MNNFDSVRVGCLATTNADGSPRATPLHFVLTDTQLVWLSPETAVHSQNISRDPHVSFTMWKSPTIALRIDGIARVASGDEALVLTRTFRKKLGDLPKLPGASVYAVARKVAYSTTCDGRILIESTAPSTV